MFNWFRKVRPAPARPGKSAESAASAEPASASSPGAAAGNAGIADDAAHAAHEAQGASGAVAQAATAMPDPTLSAQFIALARQGRMDEAAQLMRSATSRFPQVGEFHYFLGDALLSLGHPAQAVPSYHRAAALGPMPAGVHNNLGIALQASGDLAAALASFEKAVALDPGHAEAHLNRGAALADLRRPEEALAAHDRAAALAPGRAAVHTNRGIALTELRRYDEALQAYARSLQLDGTDAETHNSVGSVYLLQGRHEEALASFDRALALAPASARSLANRAATLTRLGRHDEAVATLERLFANGPAAPGDAAGLLLSARTLACDWTGRDALIGQVAQALRAGQPAISPFAWLGVSDSPEMNWRCSRAWQGSRYPAAPALWRGEEYGHAKIRVAYLSADFHNHATAFLMAGMFELHDNSRFETTALSFGPVRAGPMRERLEQAFDRFMDVSGMGDAAIARLLRELEIDIAVDLKGYTGDARPGILAFRPAPVQVSYLGYPGTLGADYIDYVIADRHVADAADERWYTEKVVYVPGSYQVNDGRRRIADETPGRAQEGLPPEGFVFCCFNNNYKIAPPVFAIWTGLLRRLPGSVLWLLEDNASAARNLRAAAESAGVDPCRLVFAPRTSPEAHLARHRLADLFLDTLPYNAHTTASDALWAGLPVLTRKGEAFAGRVASSLLHAVGLPDLVTHTPADYEALALHLATEPAALAAVRQRLHANREKAVLFDTAAFCRHIEAAYETMHARRRAGQAPLGFSVDAQA